MEHSVKRHVKFKVSEFLFVVLFLLSAVFLSFSSGGFLVNFKQVGFTILSYAQKGIYSVTSSVKDAFTAIGELKNLRKDYEELSEKLKEYEFLQRNNIEIKKENEFLRQQLNFGESLIYKNFAAEIIARDPDNLYSGITINKGSRHGIKKGFPVIAIQNGNVCVVGKIITVGYSSSIIMPLFNSNFNISSRVKNTRDIGLVCGKGDENIPLQMKYVRKQLISSLHVGDIIISSGENDNYPKDIPIGRISKLKELVYDNSLDIEVDPFVDFSKLEIVFVIDQNEQNQPGQVK